jgi:hypothetical protein
VPKIVRNRKTMELGPMLSPLVTAALFLLMSVVAGGKVYAADLGAADSTDCAADGHSLYCRLTGVLDILYVVAAVLGVVLIAIAVFAYLAYRRNRDRKLVGDDRK